MERDGLVIVSGDRHLELTPAQAQQVALARLVVADPHTLVLDEATSNLDATSEYLIQQALETLLQGRTSLIIAHRLSTILGADQIIVLDAGRIVEHGRHAELLAAGGLYATLYHQQFAKVIARAGGLPAAPAPAADTPVP